MEHEPQENRERKNNNDAERHERSGHPAPAIWVGSLADYNDGRLHGRWLQVTGDREELEDQVTAVLSSSPTPGAEEWAVFDYEGFGPLHLDEHESLEVISRLGQGITEHGPAFAHYAALVGTTDADALEHFEDAYLGHYESLVDYADGLLDDLGYPELLERSLPDAMAPYVHLDVEGFARDLELSGSVATSEDGSGVHVFDLER